MRLCFSNILFYFPCFQNSILNMKLCESYEPLFQYVSSLPQHHDAMVTALQFGNFCQNTHNNSSRKRRNIYSSKGAILQNKVISILDKQNIKAIVYIIKSLYNNLFECQISNIKTFDCSLSLHSSPERQNSGCWLPTLVRDLSLREALLRGRV